MQENSHAGFEYYKNGAVNPELVTTMAQDWANKFVPRQMQRDSGSPRQIKIKAAQLRRFYGDVKSLEMRWLNSADKALAFQEILPMIKLLKAKAAYSFSRELVPESFKIWIWQNVDMIKNEKDFKTFLIFFEAVVGFCYGNGLKDTQ